MYQTSIKQIRKVPSGQHTVPRSWFFLLISCLLASGLFAEETKWIAVGDLHNWFSEAGSEKEVGRTGKTTDQQDGLRWPALYSWQDCQAAKAMWVGATNFYDPILGRDFDYKVVHAGPRFTDIQNETMPKEFKLYARSRHPAVYVDGDIATNLNHMDEIDVINENLPADRMLKNVVQTSMGIEMTRKIYAFTNPYHQNYFIYEYIYKNNGVYNQAGDSHSQTIEGFRVYFQYRYAVSREMGSYGGNWMPQSATWGHNTMNETIGERPSAPEPNDVIYDDGDIMRALYAWHGIHSGATFNNIGAPYYSGDGHLGASQFVGTVTIHADASASDPSDDQYQPSTTWFMGSDYGITDNGSDQFNATRMAEEYNWMAKGHPDYSHAEFVCGGNVSPMCTASADEWAEPGRQNPGGYSAGQGFGPYTLAPGDSIRIVMAEGAAGISYELRYLIGENWLNDTPGPLPDDSDPDRNEYKNYWVFTGVDSIIQTFKRARNNYKSGFAVPQPPPAPDEFVVQSQGDRIHLEWSSSAETWPTLDGYRLYRAIHNPDTTYEQIADLPPGQTSFDDVTAVRGFDYYYYLVTYDDGSTNDIEPGKSMVSSKFYTLTNKPASLKRPQGRKWDQVRVVPNPYNIQARDLQYGVGAPDRIMFLDIPGKCKIRIFTERGDLVNTIIHDDGSGDATWNSITSYRQTVVSGVYIAHIEVTENINDPETGDTIWRKGDSGIKKFIIVR